MSWSQFDYKHRDSLSFRSSLSATLYNFHRDSIPPPPLSPNPPPPPPTSSNGKTSPAILFIIVILAVIFFISGLLHLLARFIIRHRYSSSDSASNRHPDRSNSEAFQRQLQQLFNQHDSGLDQAFIEALPVFQYKEIVGLKEPFDCAVCLCEFSDQDKLRLLPLCSHAFHIDCIDTWLLSNSTCPLCRGALYTPGLTIENPVFDFEDWRDWREEDGVAGLSSNGGDGGGISIGQKPNDMEIVGEKRMVFPVRLGKFKSSNDEVQGGVRAEGRDRDAGETSSSNLDARRCFSMGSYQYVVANSELQVALSSNRTANGGNPTTVKGRDGQWHNENSSINGDVKGKKINIASKNESFSVSKIWLWSKKDKFPAASNTHIGDNNSVDMSLPWNNI